LYGYAFPDEPVEIVNLWAVVTLNAKRTSTPPYHHTSPSARLGLRPVYLEGRLVDTPVYDRFRLAPRATIKGPAIIEQPDTTTLVLPRQTAVVDAGGNLILQSRKKRAGAIRPR
jgi:N-methylhydantoinase A